MRIGFAGLDVTLFITKFLLSQEFFFLLNSGMEGTLRKRHYAFFLSFFFLRFHSISISSRTDTLLFLSFSLSFSNVFLTDHFALARSDLLRSISALHTTAQAIYRF